MDEFKERLKRLKEQRKQASHANFREVLEENELKKRPANWDKKVERNERRLQEEEARIKAEEAGQSYEVQKNLNYRADEIEKWNKLNGNKRAKAGDGFVDFEEASKRQYGRSIKQLRPDLEEYNALKHEMGEEKFYLKTSVEDASAPVGPPSASSSQIPKGELIKDSKVGIERMVEDVHKQIDIRSKRSRRRRFDEDADVDYINERNMKFNKKLERFYGDCTDEIKKNFERGTAM